MQAADRSSERGLVLDKLGEHAVFLLLTTLDDKVTDYVLSQLKMRTGEYETWRHLIRLRKKALKTLLVDVDSAIVLVRLQDYLGADFDFSAWIRFVRKSSGGIADVVALFLVLGKSEDEVSEILGISKHRALIMLAEGLVLLGEELP